MLQTVYHYNKSDAGNTPADSFPKLRFIVSITNLQEKPAYFGKHLKFSYKEYAEQPFYLDAVDSGGKPVNIFGGRDIDWIIAPGPDKINTNQIVDTISTNIYKFGPGKYKVRWVYDPDFDKQKRKTIPSYSNWQDIEIVK